jgi:competence protein ComEC
VFFLRLAFDISIFNDLFLGFIDSPWRLCVAFHQALYDLCRTNSWVVSLTIFQSSVLLPGDVSRSVELDLLASRQLEVSPALLIAAHHGSNTSSSAHFIDQVASTHTVFTTEFGHQFGHPHPAVRDRFRRRDVTLWDTGIQAGISFEFSANTRLSVTPTRTSLTP